MSSYAKCEYVPWPWAMIFYKILSIKTSKWGKGTGAKRYRTNDTKDAVFQAFCPERPQASSRIVAPPATPPGQLNGSMKNIYKSKLINSVCPSVPQERCFICSPCDDREVLDG
jgi:hypothetical protein